MAVDLRKYLESLAQDAGLDEASRTVLLKVIENEKFATPLAAGISRQDEFSRAMDDLTKQRRAFEADRSSWQDWYKTASETDAAREAELQDLRKKVGGNGGGAGGGTSGSGSGDALTLKKAEELLATTRAQLIAVTKDMGIIAARHAVEFPKIPFDVERIEKIALEKGLTVAKAYDEYVRPHVEERQKADIDARIKAAHDAGIQEGLSKRGIPDESSTPRGHHVLFDRPKPDATPDTRGRVANFVEAWNKAAETPAATTK